MAEKKYAFEGKFGRWLKIPVYVSFDKLEVTELENGDKQIKAEGVPTIVGRNWFYEQLLTVATKLIILGAHISLFLDDLLDREPQPQGFYFTIGEMVEVED